MALMTKKENHGNKTRGKDLIEFFCSTTKQDTRKQFMLIYASVRWRSAGYVLRVVEPRILFTREYSKHYYSFNLTISAVILLGFTQR